MIHMKQENLKFLAVHGTFTDNCQPKISVMF